MIFERTRSQKHPICQQSRSKRIPLIAGINLAVKFKVDAFAAVDPADCWVPKKRFRHGFPPFLLLVSPFKGSFVTISCVTVCRVIVNHLPQPFACHHFSAT